MTKRKEPRDATVGFRPSYSRIMNERNGAKAQLTETYMLLRKAEEAIGELMARQKVDKTTELHVLREHVDAMTISLESAIRDNEVANRILAAVCHNLPKATFRKVEATLKREAYALGVYLTDKNECEFDG